MANINMTLQLISPAVAKAMLERNKGNFRPVDHSRVKRYAADMAAGRWWVNGEAIKTNGKILLDGQHRLHAVVLSGVTIETVVIDNLHTDSAISMDKGASRSISSWLKHEGVANATNLSAIARNAIHYMRGNWTATAVGVHGTTDAEVIQYVHDNHDRLQSAFIVARPAALFVNKSILGALMFHAAGMRLAEDCGLCVWFCQRLADGNMITNTQAVFHLRNRLMTTSPRGKSSPFVQRGLATVAWNKTARNEVCQVLHFRINGDHPSAIPDVIEPCPEN